MQEIGRGEDWGVYTGGKLLVVRSLGPAHRETIDLVYDTLQSMMQKTTGQVGFALITGAEAMPPEGDDRKRVSDLLKEHADRIAGVGMVMLAQGFRGAIVRSAASALFVLPRPGYTTKIFGDEASCAQWLAGRMTESEREIVECLQATREVFAG